MAADKVWVESDTLRSYPAATVTVARALASGTLSSVVFDLSEVADAVKLTPVPGIDNTYVALKTPGDFSSGLQDNWVLPQMVPQSNGLPSTGYAIRLYDGDPNSGGTEILTSDGTTGTGQNKSVGWFWDYAGGLLLLAEDFAPTIGTDLYVNGFVYTGLTVEDLPTTASGTTTVSGTTLPLSFTADCPTSVAVDDLVYVTGPEVGGFYQVDTVDITDRSKMPAIGIVTEKTTATRCEVVTLGEIELGLSLTPGSRYFVGTNGQPSSTMPPRGSTETIRQIIGYALSADTMMMMVNLEAVVRRPL